MSSLTQMRINRLYNQFHDTFKVVMDQQVAFDQATKGQPGSVKITLQAELYVKGYTRIKIK